MVLTGLQGFGCWPLHHLLDLISYHSPAVHSVHTTQASFLLYKDVKHLPSKKGSVLVLLGLARFPLRVTPEIPTFWSKSDRHSPNQLPFTWSYPHSPHYHLPLQYYTNILLVGFFVSPTEIRALHKKGFATLLPITGTEKTPEEYLECECNEWYTQGVSGMNLQTSMFLFPLTLPVRPRMAVWERREESPGARGSLVTESNSIVYYSSWPLLPEWVKESGYTVLLTQSTY